MYEKKDPNLPTLSVVTPAYNQGQFLRDTIESVLAQDYPNIEYVVLDDGSTDDTPKILAEYGDRFVWETQPNMGQTPTINKGWGMSSGEIIAWLNSDDTFYDQSSVSQAMEFLMDRPEVGIVFGDSMFTDETGNHLEPSPPQPAFDYVRFVEECNNTVAQPSTFIRRDVIEKVGNLDSRYYYTMDWDLWIRAGLYFTIEHVKKIWSTYRLHSESKTVAHAVKAAPELEYMYDKFFSRDDLSPEILKIKRKAMMNMAYRSAGYYLNGGNRSAASRMARKALSYNPAGLFSISNLRKFAYCNLPARNASRS
jgi:glycosyltransferase involved in cell wall biosynthesis